MKPARSIRAQLIALYVCLLAFVFLCFGAYTYWGFQRYLVHALQQTLARRAHQMASTILDELPEKGPSYVASEIQARYAPELNERVVRITGSAGSAGQEVYASKNAHLLSPPQSLPIPAGSSESPAAFREEFPEREAPLQVATLTYRLTDGSTYTVEVGAPETDVTTSLHGLILTLALGFPVLIGMAIAGGYFLLGRALKPVDEIVRSAERITLKNLHQRLPVAATGDEFERISLALNRMIERLDEAFRIANQFSSDASHELRTPLTIIRGEVEVLAKDSSINAETAEQMGTILEEVERLSRIVDGLLLVSRLDAGEAQLKREPADLGEIVNSTADQMELLSEAKLLTLSRKVSRGVMVEADAIRLKQVVVNLLDNAIKYTPEGGEISLQVRSQNNRAFFEISDTGIGISREALPHVFNRFFRSEEVKAFGMEGTGLGLAIVQSIAEAHGGTISVESDENHGTVFRVELPLLEQQTASNEIAKAKVTA
jgi:heavy metal sensor kinase